MVILGKSDKAAAWIFFTGNVLYLHVMKFLCWSALEQGDIQYWSIDKCLYHVYFMLFTPIIKKY